MVELSSCADFQDDVDVGDIVEAAIHFYDVRVVEKHLDLYFSDELVSYLLLVEQLLLDHLQSADEAGVLLFHEVDAAIFAIA